jgi:ATP-dependent protease ClpP protease subunit
MSSELKKQKKRTLKSSSSIFETKSTSEVAITRQTLHIELALEYGINLQERTITLTGEIGEPQFHIVNFALTEMERSSKKKVTIIVHSEGGSVYEALAIIGRLKASSVSKIITRGFGQVMSAATMILACGDERQISKFAYFMHHESSYGVEGRHSSIKDVTEQVEREENDWAKWMEEFTKKSKKFWKESGCRKDAFFNAAQLVKLGVADEII